MIRLNVFVRVSETNREKAIEAAKELTTCSLKVSAFRQICRYHSGIS